MPPPSRRISRSRGRYTVSSPPTPDGALEQLVKAGALDAIVLAMAAHKADLETQHAGCCALKAFCATPKCAALSLRSGALEASLNALGLPQIAPASVHIALGVLARLCAAPQGGPAVARAGGAAILLRLLQANGSKAAVQAYGLRASQSP